jgi:poly(beta-D-mannuronate) lyase
MLLSRDSAGDDARRPVVGRPVSNLRGCTGTLQGVVGPVLTLSPGGVMTGLPSSNMRLLVRLIATCACAAACTSAASAAESLVRSAAELGRAAAAAAPGDLVLLAAGEWRDVDLAIEARGTAAAPVTISAERAGETIISGKSRLRIAGEHVTVSGLAFRRAFHPDAVLEFRRDSKRLASHCRVTDCSFEDCNPPQPTRDDAKYVSIYGRENRFDHCALAGKQTRGTTLVVWLTGESSGGHRIEANYFGPRERLGSNGGETIRIGDSQTSLLSAGCFVEANLFERCDGEAEIISNKSCQNIYRHNTFRACSGALTLRHGHRCLVAGNWFFGESARGAGGVRVIGEGHHVVNNYMEGLTGDDARAGISLMTGIKEGPLHGYSPVVGAVIAHNTLLDCKQPLLIGLADEDVDAAVPPRGCTIENNLIAGSTGPLVVLRDGGADFGGAGNLLSGGSAELPPGVQATVSDPQLERSAGDWRRPSRASPARGRAAPGAAQVTVDIEGQPRRTPADVGCDEWSDAPAIHRPLLRADVGPAWLRAAAR